MGWYSKFAQRVSNNLRQRLILAKLDPLLNTWRVDIVGSSLASSVLGFHALFHAPDHSTKALIAASIGCFAATRFAATRFKLERIPFTKRYHFVWKSREAEKQFGESHFPKVKGSIKEKILPATHPDSMRVTLILKDVLCGMKRCFKNEQVCSDLSYCKYLEDLNWEVVVIDQPNDVNCDAMVGGKIVMYSGYLKHVKSDAEIATTLGHEVAHIVARHSAECIVTEICLCFLQVPLTMSQFMIPDVFDTSATYFMWLALYRGHEYEADYICMLLVASAGYDPHTAVTLFERMQKVVKHIYGGYYSTHPSNGGYYSTHPSGENRARMLAKPQVMQEAMKLYGKRVLMKGPSRRSCP